MKILDVILLLHLDFCCWWCRWIDKGSSDPMPIVCTCRSWSVFGCIWSNLCSSCLALAVALSLLNFESFASIDRILDTCIRSNGFRTVIKKESNLGFWAGAGRRWTRMMACERAELLLFWLTLSWEEQPELPIPDFWILGGREQVIEEPPVFPRWTKHMCRWWYCRIDSVEWDTSAFISDRCVWPLSWIGRRALSTSHLQTPTPRQIKNHRRTECLLVKCSRKQYSIGISNAPLATAGFT